MPTCAPVSGSGLGFVHCFNLRLHFENEKGIQNEVPTARNNMLRPLFSGRSIENGAVQNVSPSVKGRTDRDYRHLNKKCAGAGNGEFKRICINRGKINE